MSSKVIRTAPKALHLIEQAIHMLRRNTWSALAEYYLGTLPFILGLLYFWSDMSRNPMAAWYCGPTAAGVALLFIWMKIWHVRFCRRLWCRLQKADPEPWSWKRTLVTASRQTALHATGVVMLPLSLILAIPFGWVYAFYQNLCVIDDPQPKGMIKALAKAKDQALLWPGQNHMVLGLVTLFGLFVFLNIGLGLLIVPYLLKSLLDVETVFSFSGLRVLNTTYLAVLCGLTYLCVDPIVKTIYVLRCFFGYALKTGDDLKSVLRPLLCATMTTLLILGAVIPNGWAAEIDTVSTDPWEMISDGATYVDAIDGHIESVLEQRRFAWRIPREEVPEPPEEQGWISMTLKWIGDQCRSIFRTIGGWIDAFIDWLLKKMPERKTPGVFETGDQRGIIRWVFYAVGFGLALWLIVWMVRWLKNSRPVTMKNSELSDCPGEIDLTDESVTAKDLPLDRWLAMAREMMDRNDYRKALRALYLSVLALLADHERVKIAPYKSNRDYARELARRAHSEPEVLKLFDWCIGAFERSWYGMHPVGKKLLDNFVSHQERLTALVQPAS